MIPLYLVSGCGFSAICTKGEGMLWIIMRIIQKGGVPKIVPFYPEIERAA